MTELQLKLNTNTDEVSTILEALAAQGNSWRDSGDDEEADRAWGLYGRIADLARPALRREGWTY